jgi:hypothetical protein
VAWDAVAPRPARRGRRHDPNVLTGSLDETSDECVASMLRFADWLASLRAKRLVFISDNNGYDWQFVNWYFHHFLGRNPFGFSSQNLGSLYKGLVKDTFSTFKHLRRTAHTHHPVDDARGNAEALLHMKEAMGLKIALD